MTPVLADLHWLPVLFRIDFKILLFTFKTLYNLEQGHLKDLLTPCVPGHSLRSVDAALLIVLIFWLVTKGDQPLLFEPPDCGRLYTSPIEIRQATSLASFKSLLKTFPL